MIKIKSVIILCIQYKPPFCQVVAIINKITFHTQTITYLVANVVMPLPICKADGTLTWPQGMLLFGYEMGFYL